MATKLRALIDAIKRAIKDVASWDGSASNYKDTNAYCAACLIDVNQSDTKAQDHCMLPVREDGDGADTYVRQAVHAAAGGRGISAVKKPDDVDQDQWDSAVKTAANKIIEAYGEMEEDCPESIYEMAGKEKPAGEGDNKPAKDEPATEEPAKSTEAKSLDEVYFGLYDQVMAVDEWGWLNGCYVDQGQLFAVISSNGKLYRADVSIAEDQLVLSPDWIEVKLDFPAVAEQSRFKIIRQADGKKRWFSLSCSATLNRSGAVDSRALFDSFIQHAEETGEYPIRQFFHAGKQFRTGQCDFLARDGYILITSGLYDDTELAQKEIEARSADPGYWGDSIGFYPDEISTIDVNGVEIPVYEHGVLDEISTLPEHQAASWFTATPTIKEVRMLDKRQMEALTKLFDGDEEAASKWLEENVDPENRRIKDAGMVTREVEQPQEQPETQPTPDEPVTNPADLILDDEAFNLLVERVSAARQDVLSKLVEDAITKVQQSIDELVASQKSLSEAVDKRLKKLESTDDEKHRIWLEDAPKIRVAQTSRPRQPQPDEEPETDSPEEPEFDTDTVVSSVLGVIPK